MTNDGPCDGNGDGDGDGDGDGFPPTRGLPELLGAAIGGAWQLAGGDPLSSALVTAGTTVAMRLDVENMSRRLHRSGRVVERAAEELGGLDQLEILASDSDARLELTARVLEAAARSTLDEKIPALSRVLADGLSDDTRVDEALFHASALTDLEAPHVRVLATIARSLPEKRTNPELPPDAAGWDTGELLQQLPAYAPVLPAIIATLSRHGLIVDVALGTWDYAARWDCTEPGRRCLKLLRPAVG